MIFLQCVGYDRYTFISSDEGNPACGRPYNLIQKGMVMKLHVKLKYGVQGKNPSTDLVLAKSAGATGLVGTLSARSRAYLLLCRRHREKVRMTSDDDKFPDRVVREVIRANVVYTKRRFSSPFGCPAWASRRNHRYGQDALEKMDG